MKLIHDKCICEKCRKYKVGCKKQKFVEDLQRAIAHHPYKDMEVEFYVKECKGFEEGKNENI